MIVRGMLAANSPDMILRRALVGLFGGLALGMVLGWIGKTIAADHLPAPELAEDSPAPTPPNRVASQAKRKPDSRQAQAA